jgi:hypothetical protein
MIQYNLFGEIEEPVMILEPEPEPEVISVLPPEPYDPDKPFIVVRCHSCSQKLFVPRKIKGERYLCQDCDIRYHAKYDRFRNFALAQALRAHKMINH